jgi:type IV pilus assembly protein PilX
MNRCKRPSQKTGQQGIVLPITLIVLVAMTLAGIALLRSIDTSSIIAGNLAFKQSATASGDAGVESAISWLTANYKTLDQDNKSSGYYATRQDALDMTGNMSSGAADNLNWDDASRVKTLAADTSGNVVSYVIHRMCAAAGPLDASTCSTEQSVKSGSSKGLLRQMMTYQQGAWQELANRGYYRITARVTGPRNTTSYVQVVVLI